MGLGVYYFADRMSEHFLVCMSNGCILCRFTMRIRDNVCEVPCPELGRLSWLVGTVSILFCLPDLINHQQALEILTGWHFS